MYRLTPELLQDHFRKVVKPAYTNVYRDRGGLIGVVEFESQDDLDLAIRKLDDTEVRNPFERAYIRIRDESDHKARQRSRSRSRWVMRLSLAFPEPSFTAPGFPGVLSHFSCFPGLCAVSLI